tara:strand:- start:148453 stop:148617 length:165 start_codon:yes stop_codon:yes gene_type:complete
MTNFYMNKFNTLLVYLYYLGLMTCLIAAGFHPAPMSIIISAELTAGCADGRNID